MIVLTELTVLGFGVRRRESWYLADLVCTASLEGRGLRREKLAAHHACTFRTQASCETTNPVLYRALVPGTPDEPGVVPMPKPLESTIRYAGVEASRAS